MEPRCRLCDGGKPWRPALQFINESVVEATPKSFRREAPIMPVDRQRSAVVLGDVHEGPYHGLRGIFGEIEDG